MELFLNLDRHFFRYLNGWHTPFMDYTNFFLSFIGEGAVTVFIFIIWYIFSRKKIALLGIGSMAASGIITQILKKIFARPRPLAVLTSVHTFGNAFKCSSFPSGHATTIFAAATILAFSYKKFAPFFYLLAFAVSYSRVYLGMHWPSDVIAGGIIGYATSKLFLKYFNPRINANETI